MTIATFEALTCPTCGGSGLIEQRVLRMGWRRNRRCPTCKGTGHAPPAQEIKCISHPHFGVTVMGSDRVRADNASEWTFWLEFTLGRRPHTCEATQISGRTGDHPPAFEVSVIKLRGVDHPSYSVKIVDTANDKTFVFLVSPSEA